MARSLYVGYDSTRGKPAARARGPNIELIVSAPAMFDVACSTLARPSLPVIGRRDVAHSCDRDEQPRGGHVETCGPSQSHRGTRRQLSVTGIAVPMIAPESIATGGNRIRPPLAREFHALEGQEF